MASKLYPPQIEGILPAFYKTYSSADNTNVAVLTIPFGLNRAVSLNEIYDLQIRLKTVSTNEQICIKDSTIIDKVNLIAYFNLSDADLSNIHEGQFYKAQVCFTSLADGNNPSSKISGYWSTVGTIKCVSEPTIQIGNFNANQTNQFTQELIGEYIQDTTYGDSTEKVEYYEFNLWNANNELVLSSGQQLHNSADDISSYASQDVFKINYLIKEETLYYVQYSVKTLNNLTISSPKYQIMQNASVDIESPLIIYCENVFDEGYIKINLYGGKTLNEQESAANGTFLISRGSSKDNYFEWVEIVRFNINIGLPSAYSFKDFTIEQGEVYKYRIQQYNTYGLYSNPVYMVDVNDINNTEATVYADFEDMFLYDGKRQLKIRFNPKVSNFKNTIPEQKIETIGSKYPFIFRNGLVNYKEFSIGGLISYVMDNDLLFLVDDEIEQSGVLGKNTSRLSTRVFDKKNNSLNLHEISENTRKMLQLENITSSIIAENEYKNYDDIKEYYQTGNIVRDDKNLTSENITSERFFKLKVLDWLTDGKVKLFKSPTEGNYLVRLLNVSMTPQDQLGRMLHNFTCTAYEIAELNYSNLVYYGIQSEQILNLMEYHWESLVYLNAFYNNDLILDSEGFYKYRTNTNTIEDFICEDFAPGDIIRVSFTSQTTKEYFVIGNSGHYNYSFDNRTISEIALKPISTESFYEFNRILTYSYEGVQIKKFDDIKNIRTQTQVGQQYVGPYENLYEQYTINENMDLSDLYRHANIFLSDDSPKFKVLDTEILYVQKRLLIPIYCISSIDLENISNSLSSNLYVLTPYLNQPEYVDKLNLNNYIDVLPTSIISSEKYQYDNIELLKENPDILDIDKPSNIVDIKDKRVLININDQPYPMPIDYHVMLQVFISQVDDEGKNVWNPLNYYYDPYTQDWTNKYEPYFSINEDIPIERNDLISEESNDNKFYMNLNKIYLTETNDITLTNLGKIDKLELGNGVIADVTFQLQIIDYSLEDDISQAVYNYKQEYLAEKEKYTTNLINYYTSLLKSTSVDSSIVKELNDKKEEKDNLEKQIGSYDEKNDSFLSEYQPLEGESETPSLIVLKNFLISELNESSQNNTYLSIANKTLSSQNIMIGNIKEALTSTQPFKADGTEFADNEKTNYWCCSFDSGEKDATGLNKSNKRWFPKTSIQQEDEYFINDDSMESQEKNKQLFTLLLSKNYNNNNNNNNNDNNNDNTQQFFYDVGLHNLLKILDCRINGRDETVNNIGKYINIKSDFNPESESEFTIGKLKEHNCYFPTNNIQSNDDISWNNAFVSLKDFISDNEYNYEILKRKFYDKTEITSLDLENEIINNKKSIKELLRDADNEQIDFEKNKFKRSETQSDNKFFYNYYPLADDIQKNFIDDIDKLIGNINSETKVIEPSSYAAPQINIEIKLPWVNNTIIINNECTLKIFNENLNQSFISYCTQCETLRNHYETLAKLTQEKKNAEKNVAEYNAIVEEIKQYNTQITALEEYLNKISESDLDQSIKSQYENTIDYKITLLEELRKSKNDSIAEGTDNFKSFETFKQVEERYQDAQKAIDTFLDSNAFIDSKTDYSNNYNLFIIPYNKYLALSDSYNILTNNEYCYPMDESDLEEFNKIIGLKDIQKIQGQRLTRNINLNNYRTKIDALKEIYGNINEKIKNFYTNIEEIEYNYFIGTQNYTQDLTKSITNIDQEILNKQSQIRQLSIQIKTLSTMQSNIDNDKPTKENEQNISQKLLQYLKILSKYYNLENGGI